MFSVFSEIQFSVEEYAYYLIYINDKTMGFHSVINNK